MKHTNDQGNGVHPENHPSSIDIIIRSFSRLLTKAFHLKSSPAPWIIILILSFIISLIIFVISFLVEGFSISSLRTILFGCALLIANFLGSKYIFDQTFRGLKDMFLQENAPELPQDRLTSWFALAKNIKIPLIIGVIVYVINVAFVLRDPVNSPTSVETALMGGLMLLWTGFILYYMYIFCRLPLKLKKCKFRIHKENPARSQVLKRWNKMMNITSYIFALMLAAGTLFTLSITPFRVRILIFIIPRWLLLIVLFVVNQTILSQIITKIKNEALKKIEGEMASIRTDEGSISTNNKALMGLWDYHDRILNTKNSFMDVKGVINFISTLLIPLLAFIAANYKEIIAFFNWN